MMIILAISIGWPEAIPLKASMISIILFFLPDLVPFQPEESPLAARHPEADLLIS